MKEEKEEIEKMIVWKFDGVTAVYITADHFRGIPFDFFKWNYSKEDEQFVHSAEYLTLAEIQNQLEASDEYCGHIIEVRIENPLSGKIYQYGNYGKENGKYNWVEHGTLRGYA